MSQSQRQHNHSTVRFGTSFVGIFFRVVLKPEISSSRCLVVTRLLHLLLSLALSRPSLLSSSGRNRALNPKPTSIQINASLGTVHFSASWHTLRRRPPRSLPLLGRCIGLLSSVGSQTFGLQTIGFFLCSLLSVDLVGVGTLFFRLYSVGVEVAVGEGAISARLCR